MSTPAGTGSGSWPPHPSPTEREAATGKLTTTLHRRGRDGRLPWQARTGGPDPGRRPGAGQGHRAATELVEALAYRAELALRAEDAAAAGEAIARARAFTLSGAERDRLAETLAALEDLAAALRPPQP